MHLHFACHLTDSTDKCNCGKDVARGEVWSKARSDGGVFYLLILGYGAEMQRLRSMRVSFSWRAKVKSRPVGRRLK
jgi:hypothetical protein